MAVRLPITTVIGHVNRAICFYELPNIYFAIGKQSPWEGETEEGFSAPLPSVNATHLDELIGMKRVTVRSLVVPDEEGTVLYRDQNWRKISVDDAIALGAHWVYIEASLYYDEVPAAAYRQIGVYSRVTPKEFLKDVEGNILHDSRGNKLGPELLLPEDIENEGILEIIDQRKVVNRNEDSRDTFSMIIEF